MPGACQSRAVTEPQREKARLKLDKPPQKGLMYQDFRAKRHFERFQNARRISAVKKVSQAFLTSWYAPAAHTLFLAHPAPGRNKASGRDILFYLAYGVLLKARDLRLRYTHGLCDLHLCAPVVKAQRKDALFAL